MTTITREQALKIIEAADEVISALAGTNEDVHPGSDNMLRLWDDLNDRYAPPEVVRELARIALASLEAEPVGAFHIAEQQVDGTSDYLKDGEWPIDNGIIEVYAAPPVPVVPAALPENDDEDGHDIDYLEPSEVYALGRTAGWNACRAAMLQSGNFRENKNSSTNNFREIAETSTNYPVIPGEVLSAILKVAR
ncbi:TPA: Eaa protein, partial [Escherichia coli]|nr:Eaa protein [Escherichia coli]